MLKNKLLKNKSNPLAHDYEENNGNAENSYAASKQFVQLPISKATKEGLKNAGYIKMTDIQRASIPHALAGRGKKKKRIKKFPLFFSTKNNNLPICVLIIFIFFSSKKICWVQQKLEVEKHWHFLCHYWKNYSDQNGMWMTD